MSQNCARCCLGRSQESKIITSNNQTQTKQIHALSLTSPVCSCMDGRAHRSCRMPLPASCSSLRLIHAGLLRFHSALGWQTRRVGSVALLLLLLLLLLTPRRLGSSQPASSHAETVWNSFTPWPGMRIWTGACPGDNYASRHSSVPLPVLLTPQRK